MFKNFGMRLQRDIQVQNFAKIIALENACYLFMFIRQAAGWISNLVMHVSCCRLLFIEGWRRYIAGSCDCQEITHSLTVLPGFSSGLQPLGHTGGAVNQ